MEYSFSFNVADDLLHNEVKHLIINLIKNWKNCVNKKYREISKRLLIKFYSESPDEVYSFEYWPSYQNTLSGAAICTTQSKTFVYKLLSASHM